MHLFRRTNTVRTGVKVGTDNSGEKLRPRYKGRHTCFNHGTEVGFYLVCDGRNCSDI